MSITQINQGQHFFKKSLGQNFLKSRQAVQELLASAKITTDDLLIEIGPGRGAITRELCEVTQNIILIEKDNNLINYLEEQFGNKVKIINADVLKVNFSELILNRPYKVIGSLPYNVSKKIIFNFLKAAEKPQLMSFIVQREVAKDYAATAPRASLLSNFANLYSDVKLLKVIPAKSFIPEPKVDGQIIVFKNIREKSPDTDRLWSLIRTGFSSPRKVLASNLRKYDKAKVTEILKEIGLSTTARASELSFDNWVLLDNMIQKQK